LLPAPLVLRLSNQSLSVTSYFHLGYALGIPSAFPGLWVPVLPLLHALQLFCVAVPGFTVALPPRLLEMPGSAAQPVPPIVKFQLL